MFKIRHPHTHRHTDTDTILVKRWSTIMEDWTTLFESAANVKFFSASTIFPIRSQSRRRCSTREEFLLSKHDTMMFSMWWCRKLLYGYLAIKQGLRTKIKSSSFKLQEFWTYSKNRSKILCTAPRQINSFSAASLPTASNTDMNSTIWKIPSSVVRAKIYKISP